MEDLYVHNNGKGWAVFLKNTTGEYTHRDFGYVAEAEQWSLGWATYFDSRVEAERLMAKIKDRILNPVYEKST